MEFYTFGLGEYKSESKELLGGKGQGLCWMSSKGIPVPPGFVIPTTVWAQYDKSPKTTMKEISKELKKYLIMLRDHFGYDPLFSIRSGARDSMPGMLDTILNVGLDSSTHSMWKDKLGPECWESSAKRLVTMFGSVVKNIDRKELEKDTFIESVKVYEEKSGEEFPNAFSQILLSIEAVFKSWDNERAIVYRKLHNIPRDWGTAVTVQAMVFGNLNDQSGTGVLFTRNPDTGENKITGEFLEKAQGEDVVAGIRTPISLDHLLLGDNPKYSQFKEVAIELNSIVKNLETLKKDMQDVEFTVQDGNLYILQTRNGKRTPQAALRIGMEMVKENLIDVTDLVKRVSTKQLDLAQMDQIDPSFKGNPCYTGIGACSGVVTGKPVFSAKDAINCKEPCILVTQETTPDDIAGMLAAKGVITMEGGLTSHAAVVARGENKPCITGVGAEISKFNTPIISMDGATGRIWFEKIPVISGGKNGLVEEFINTVSNSLGIVPVINSIPTKIMKSALYRVGSKVFDPVSGVIELFKIVHRVENLYIDFSISEEVEKKFYSICGSLNIANSFISNLEGALKNPILFNRVIIIGSVNTNFKKLENTSDLRDIILAEKEIAFGSNIDTTDKALNWVLAKRKEEGNPISPVVLGNYIPNTKSICSIEQLLVSMQN